MLWLCLHCPKLPLETLYPELHEQNTAIVIAEQHRVYCCNQTATDAGIKVDMAIATAQVLYPGLQINPRNSTHEHRALLNLAQACYQFTPAITPLNENTLLLEIRSSLKLFHGLHNLLGCIQEEIALHKLSYTLGLANTPRAAQLMICHSTQNDIVQVGGINCIDNESGKINQQASFDKLLNSTLITHLDYPGTVIKKLTRSGLGTLGQIYRLPLAALGKRYGKDLVRYLQRVNGQLSDPQNYITLPETFENSLEFDDAISDTDKLLLTMQTMLHSLSSYLRGRQMYCRSFTWFIYQYRNYFLDTDMNNETNNSSHKDKKQHIITIKIHLTQARWDADHFSHLTRIKVEALKLTAPIIGIRLFTHDLGPAEYVHNDLLPVDIHCSNQQADQKLDKHIQTLVDTLSARLGKTNLYQLAHHDRHIPEQASLSNALFNKDFKTEVNSGSKTRPESGVKISLNELRPSWLLPQPSPIKNRQQSLYWRGRLTLLRGPERIEGDWWRTAVSRDYYLALHQDNTLYWVYRDRYTRKWFVHGIFG